jgi:hypothetical protein
MNANLFHLLNYSVGWLTTATQYLFNEYSGVAAESRLLLSIVLALRDRHPLDAFVSVPALLFVDQARHPCL